MRITMLGDTMCSHTYMQSFETITEENYVKSLECIKKIKETSDYVILNLETPVAGCENGYSEEQYSFNAPIEFARAIKSVGVDMVMCANNHCLDRGLQGLLATIKNLKTCGLDIIGIHDKREKSYKIVDISGIKVGFLNFTYGTNAFANGQYLKRKDRHKVDLLQKQELYNMLTRKIWNSNNRYIRKLKSISKKFNIGQFNVYAYERRERDFLEKRHFVRSIVECEKRADYVVVFPHVGGQYNKKPSEYTRKICHLAVKHGADAVIANHEHLIHPAGTSYLADNKLVAYSMGNFLGIKGVLEGPYDKMAEYSVAIHIDIEDERKPRFYFSIYKTVLINNIVKTMALYDLINLSNVPEEKELLLQHNAAFVKLVLGLKNENVEFKQFYEIKT